MMTGTISTSGTRVLQEIRDALDAVLAVVRRGVLDRHARRQRGHQLITQRRDRDIAIR
jgi:hypothetical protein